MRWARLDLENGYVPGQASQPHTAPAGARRVPGGHVSFPDAPTAKSNAQTHCVLPWPVVVSPSGQGVHEVAPGPEIVPTPHTRQSDAPGKAL